jgi:hypothetical protein
MNESLLQKLTGEIVDAVCSSMTAEAIQHVHRPIGECNDVDVAQEIQKFGGLIGDSPLLRRNLLLILMGLARQLEAFQLAQEAVGFNIGETARISSTGKQPKQPLPGLISILNAMPDKARVDLIGGFGLVFFAGWHARGILEDAECLPKL